jgi:ABC-type Fe3+/spermidine/putrescine transport system ATPase subunit
VPSPVSVSIRGLSKRFGSFTAVDGISLELRRGEIVALLGPSGCGKTTTLRMVAGLERPSAGQIVFEERVVDSVPDAIHVAPHQRNVGMVFQSYALWPHLSVFENVAYPLKLRGRARREIEERVAAILGLMGLSDLARQGIPQLSGGQQQRVALARALVYEPGLMLFDEPFSNLDAKLRGQMRLELKSLRRKVDMTGFFVTHDQVEALSIADRIAIMSNGRIEQVGGPREVYERPATPFVRDFLGHAVKLRGAMEGGGVRVGQAMFAAQGPSQGTFRTGDAVELSIRPECIEFRRGSGAQGDNTLAATVEELLFTGDRYEAKLNAAGQGLLVELPSDAGWREGDAIFLRFPADKLSLWPAR